MTITNNKYTSKSIESMEEQLDRVLAHQERFGTCTRTNGWVKWLTNENYRKRCNEFNKSVAEMLRYNRFI